MKTDFNKKSFVNPSSESTLKVSFNCIEDYLIGRKTSVLYLSVNDISMSLDEKEMIELHEHLGQLIKTKRRLDNQAEIKELRETKDKYKKFIKSIDEKIEYLEG